MRLRSLEIQGFKSFPDKTKLTFNDGITAVVGPNGSGKSNIADAVRWVLGEQSTKTLRGGKMEDVIFGGTQTRKPQGFASVQLVIDNADGALGQDSPEVSVMRKLYRSGESEYRINGVSVRLKDVYELFMDTGLGRDGYSIIGQGKIAEIVSAKSTQRREIFEEAAGISKYRYRKAEAQHRLQSAEENLLRLKDILTELEVRVEPLRVQAEKAEQFLTLSTEKKSLEISIWIVTLERSKAVLREQEDKILICKEDHSHIQAELDEIEITVNTLFAKMQTLLAEIDTSRTLVRELEDLCAQSNADIAVMQNDFSHNEASIARIEEELEQADISDAGLDQKIGTYEQEAAEKRKLLQQLREKEADTDVRFAQISQSKEQLQADLDSQKDIRFGLTQSVNEAKLSSATSATLIDETISRLELLRESAVIKDENINRIQSELGNCTGLLSQIDEAVLSLQNSRKGYQIKLSGRQEKQNQLLEQRRKLEDQARTHRQRAKLLFDMENSLEGFYGSVKYVMSQAHKGALGGVFGPVSRLIQVEDQHALAIEIALGSAMQNIVVKDESAAKRAIAMLRDAKAGRATFLPVSTVKGNKIADAWLPDMEGFVGIAVDLIGFDSQFSGVMQQMLGRTVIAEDIDCATVIAKKAGYRFRIVTLDGQVVNAGGSMTGGYAAKSAGILSRGKEIEALKEKAAACEAEMAKLDGEIKSAQEEISAVQAVITGTDAELSTAQEDKIRYTSESKQLQAAYEDALRVKQQSAREYDQLAARLEELKTSNASNTDVVADMQEQLESVAQKIAQLGEKREQFSGQETALQNERSKLQVQLAALEQEISGAQQMTVQLHEQKENRKQHRQSLHTQVAQYRMQNEQITAKILQMEQGKRDYRAQIEQINTQVAQKTQSRNACEAQSNALRNSEKEIMSRRETAARELARLEEQKMSLQANYDSIIARLWDEYELTRSQAVEIAQPVENENEAQRTLAQIKSKIKSLGNVNVGAVEEYKEVSERYLFLKTQTDDVEKSRVELMRLIDELTREMQDIFADNFRQITAHFSRIFVQLFGGGKAELTLTDPQNILESGIEIYVQPPGKIIKNLAALSGGEQAFVAIAIYFAIMKVRPSPFCLLDEIEAALDDVNVVKYAQYLRTMCDKTQFIAITHRRGTMEEADMLYGVTMQEEGVSKLLTLNVGEIEQKLGMKS